MNKKEFKGSYWLAKLYSRLNIEVWKNIYNKKFQISNIGRVYNPKTANYIGSSNRSKTDIRKAHVYKIFNQTASSTTCIHREVFKAFFGFIKKGYDVDHINFIKNDNRLFNLRQRPLRKNRTDWNK